MSQTLQRITLLALGMLLTVTNVQADRISDIRNTKHNFSATVVPNLPGGEVRDVQASSESQVCAFCHTPHGANNAPKAPIWNRKFSGATYTPYDSTSMDALDVGQPNTKSKLCLSCHDGTLAIGTVNVLNREVSPTVDVAGTDSSDGSIPAGMGERSGFTRRLGIDLTNDHPISFTYDSAQAFRDGELRDPNAVAHMGEREPGHRPTLPLEDGQMECISCHDPHIRDTSGENIKFLRVNRFQQAAPVEGTYDQANDIICLACHEKAGWALSAHGNPAVAAEYKYTDAAAELREFPKDTEVWQAACLNCHDPHTVQGSRRLLREGTDDASGAMTTAGASLKQGGKAAIEEACYACHSADGNVLQGQGNAGFGVPDVKTDFTSPGNIHMPISSADQPASEERHSIGTATDHLHSGKDFLESRERLGYGNLMNRHAECTDCHNPHRVTKNRRFDSHPANPDPEGTHEHGLGGIHSNIASGVLRGTWGVEPVYGSEAFMSEPVGFDVKKGDPGTSPSTNVEQPYVTREYQVCLKCHSNYSYVTPPPLGANHSGGTPAGTNSLFNYTNQAMEYQSPIDHAGEGTATPTGAYVGGAIGDCTGLNTGTMDVAAAIAGGQHDDEDGYLDPEGNCVDWVTNNHRAWHPVMRETGRDPATRDADSEVWKAPFNGAGVGIQTMYCTDCHGSSTDFEELDPVVEPGSGGVWGPHGSKNAFLLKGEWTDETGQNDFLVVNDVDPPIPVKNGLCFKCHNYNYYGRNYSAGANVKGNTLRSGFSRDPSLGTQSCLYEVATNLHTGHAQDGQVTNFQCNFCHIAIPHGWKNKNFLANLNDVGPEVGLPQGGTQVRRKTTARYYEGPYYNGTVLKVINFKKSGEWRHSSCGSSGEPGNGYVGGNNNYGNIPWMTDPGAGSEACNLLP